MARRLKNLVRSWKEACTAPAQAKPSLPHSTKAVGEPRASVGRPPSAGLTSSVNSHHPQSVGETNQHSAPLSSTLNSQTHSLTHPLHPFPQLSVAEIEASVGQTQVPVVLPSLAKRPESQAQRAPELSSTRHSPLSALSEGVPHSLAVCISLNQLPVSLVDRLKRQKERQAGSHLAIAQEPPPALPCAVDLPPNTVVLPPHSVVFPPRSLSPHPRQLSNSPSIIPPSHSDNLIVNIPLHKVFFMGAVCTPALENGSSGSPCETVGGATLNHTPAMRLKQLGLPPSSVSEDSSEPVGQQKTNEAHAEENSVVCWRYTWTDEGWHSGIHGYFDHTGQWNDWTMPLPSHKDSVGVLPYVYID